MSGGFGFCQTLIGRLAEEQAGLDQRIARERARSTPDEPLLRRLQRERTLTRDRLAALSSTVMPPWARVETVEGNGQPETASPSDPTPTSH
jgi:hypothetical protein